MAFYNIMPGKFGSNGNFRPYSPDNYLNRTHLYMPYNASNIYILAPIALDDDINCPASIYIMLLGFIMMVNLLMLFCLLTNPVPEPCDQSKKKAVAQVHKKLKKDHLKIDWSGLKISQEQLENLSKIEIHPLSEQATLSAAAGKNLKDAVKGARSKA